MNEETDHILALIARARSAWDQYNIQLALPADPRWIEQGHPWDAFNNGRRAPQIRRDPAATGAAWNRLQNSLVELSDVANRVRGRAAPSSLTTAVDPPYDRRVGAFSRAPIVEQHQALTPEPSPATAAPSRVDAPHAVQEQLADEPALVR